MQRIQKTFHSCEIPNGELGMTARNWLQKVWVKQNEIIYKG